MTFLLRPYQLAKGNEILAGLIRNRNPLLVLPTRGGKTAIACYVMGEILRATDWHMGFFVDRIELLRQASAALTRNGIEHGMIKPGEGVTSHRVHVASIDTVITRLSAGDTDIARWVLRIKVMFADEAHHFPAEKWQRVRAMALNVLICGFTATPYHPDGRGLGHAGFDTAVIGPLMTELQDMGYLARFKIFGPGANIDLSKLRLRGADFAAEDIQALVSNPDFVMQAARAYAKFAAGQGCIIFGAGTAHAESMAEGMRRAGWMAKSIDGDMPAREREQAVSDLGAGSLHGLASCDILGEGVDLPAVAAMIEGRPSWSTRVFMQHMGRPLTVHEDKSEAILVDLVGNTARHGMPDAIRPWSLFDGIKGLERQVPPTSRCPKCTRIFEIADRCPECGVGQLKSKDSNAPPTVWHLPGVAGLRPERIAAMNLGAAVEITRSRIDLERVAAIKGQDMAWVGRMTKHLGLREAAE